jgi:cytochrome P450
MTASGDAPLVEFNPFAPDFREDPYPSYARMRAAGPIIRTLFGPLLVTQYAAADRVLRSPAFRTPRGYRDADDPAGPPRYDPNGPLSLHRRHWIVFQSGEAHTRLRRLITKVFTVRAVKRLAPRIETIVERLIAPSLERGAMEVIRDLAYPLPATVICELLGIPESDRDRFRAWAAAIVHTLDPIASDEHVAAAEQAMREWDPYLRELLAERRRQPGEALLDEMLGVEEEGSRLTEDEIAANATFLFLAGHETTTNLIGNGLLALLRSPEQLERLRADLGVVENAVEELLRFESPVQFTSRVAIEPTEIEGARVEAEHPIMLALGAANRDERRYEHPEVLDVRRADVKPLSFGGGAHFCVGAALARVEGKIAFERLLGRIAKIELTTNQVAWRPGINFRALVELPITVKPA